MKKTKKTKQNTEPPCGCDANAHVDTCEHSCDAEFRSSSAGGAFVNCTRTKGHKGNHAWN